MATKKCQFCAEEIQEDAVTCKHCGKDQKNKIQQVGETMTAIGCALTLLVTIPVILIVLFLAFC